MGLLGLAGREAEEFITKNTDTFHLSNTGLLTIRSHRLPLPMVGFPFFFFYIKCFPRGPSIS